MTLRRYIFYSISRLKYSTVAAKPSNLITNFLNNRNLVIPQKLQKKKHKYPEHIYINNSDAAEIIAKQISENISHSTFVEVNPGNGFLTSYLLNNDNIKKLILYELYPEFLPKFEELHAIYPDRVEVKHGDFVNLWKLVFRDKLDNGTRVTDFLELIPKKNFNDDINMNLFSCVGSYNFIKHLINSIVFHTSIFGYGRCEMFLVVLPEMFLHLTCTKEAGYSMYRSTSVLFQIMFEYKYLTKIPKLYFLPEIFDGSGSKKTKKNKTQDPEFLYLIKLVPRQNIYQLCSIEDMPALWYFVKQCFFSRKTRVIPFLEKWIPGCGPRLIINIKKPKPVEIIHTDENLSELPVHSVPCTTMSNEDFYTSFNIFTQFGDLSPSNMLTLFLQFRNMPEYKESPFLASLESSLLKMEQASDDVVDSIVVPEEDDHNEVIKKEPENETIKKKKLL